MADRHIHALLDLLARRWCLRLLWELRRDALAFSELRDRCGASPSVLSQRLRELRAEGLVERDPARRYRLSGRGRELAVVMYELNRFAEAAAGDRARAIVDS